MVGPFRAYRTFAKIAKELEIEFNLQKTNHQPRKSRSENLADDMERHSGIESLINWMKRHCVEKIEGAHSWAEIHRILKEQGLKIKLKANGLSFSTH